MDGFFFHHSFSISIDVCMLYFSSGSMVRAVILMSCMLLLYFQLLSKFYNLECTRRQSIPTWDGSNYIEQWKQAVPAQTEADAAWKYNE